MEVAEVPASTREGPGGCRHFTPDACHFKLKWHQQAGIESANCFSKKVGKCNRGVVFVVEPSGGLGSCPLKFVCLLAFPCGLGGGRLREPALKKTPKAHPKVCAIRIWESHRLGQGRTGLAAALLALFSKRKTAF